MSENPNPETRTDGEPETPITPPQPASEPAVPPTTTTPPAADPIDYETKFKESTRENQVLQARLDAEAKARRESTKEPTDSELQAAFPEWEFMSDTEKRSSRLAFNADRTARAIAAEREEEKAKTRWDNDLEATISAHPELEGKERQFKEYANKPTHKGAPIETLVKAFLFDSKAPTPAPAPDPAPALETGTGGPKTPEKPKQMSGEELKQLRQTDEKAYKDYIRTHDLSDIAD
jgi:hypothetical protein